MKKIILALGWALMLGLLVCLLWQWPPTAPEATESNTSTTTVAPTLPQVKAAGPATVTNVSSTAPDSPALSKADRLMLGLVQRMLANEHALPNQAVVKFGSLEEMRQFLRLAASHKLPILGRIDALKTVRIGYSSPEQLRNLLLDGGTLCDNLDVNYYARMPSILQQQNLATKPEGGYASYQDAGGFLTAIGANTDRSTWGKNVLVAVVDSGVEDHPTFAPGQITHYDLVKDALPFNGHGTAMASLIAGQDPQAPGVAPGSKIVDVRVLNSQGEGDGFTLAAGIVQASDAGATVINLSVSSYGDSQPVREAVAYAESRGSVVIAAAGNDNTADQLAFPAAIASVISVGGVDANKNTAYFSNAGDGLTVAAPAVGIQSAYGTNKLVLGDGTSQATAITSGILAYGIANGSTSAAGAAAWLQKNALPLDQPAKNVGAGMVQIPAK